MRSDSQKTWTAVDEYLNAKLGNSDPILEATLSANAAAGLPPIDVAPNQGKFLHLLARMSGAKRILEIGTLGGYSTIWLARAVPPGGTVVTLESEPKHVEVASRNIRNAGLRHVVEIRPGLALSSLEQLVGEAAQPFDFVFIDADKPNNPRYLEGALKLSRPGTIIVADNVIRAGAITDSETTDPRVGGVRKFFDDLAADGRLTATALQTVGSKGYDGFALALVTR
jgi:predicted O-methyltransferase YrrM